MSHEETNYSFDICHYYRGDSGRQHQVGEGQLNKVDVSQFADLPGLKNGDYYLVVDAAWGFSFYRTGYQYLGKIALP